MSLQTAIARTLPLLVLATLGGQPVRAQESEAQQSEARVGRLFFTPEERADMDRKRFAIAPAPPAPKPAPVEAAPPPRDDVTLNGFVRRSSGHMTTWVNGVPENDRSRLDESGDVRVVHGSKAVELRVGDTVDPITGRRQPLLHGGRVAVKP